MLTYFGLHTKGDVLGLVGFLGMPGTLAFFWVGTP